MEESSTITIPLVEYEKLKEERDRFEEQYKSLTKDVENFFRLGRLEKFVDHRRMLTSSYRITIDETELGDGKLKGFFEYEIKRRAHLNGYDRRMV